MKKLYKFIANNSIEIAMATLVAMLAVLALTGGEVGWLELGFFGIAGLCFIFLIVRRYLLVLFLVGSLVLQPVNVRAQEQQLNAWGVPVAVTVVVCGVTYCIYKLVRFCQKHLPKDKPANTNEVYIAFGGAGDEYGGSWNHGSLGSCLQPSAFSLQPSPDSPTTFSLNVFVASSAFLVTTMSAVTGLDSWQTWSQFQADVASHGLTVTGRNDGSQFFSRNRQPVQAGEVPIRFDQVTGEVKVGEGELVKIIVERSTDLEAWYPILTVQHQVGSAFEVLDTSIDSSAFYRATIAP